MQAITEAVLNSAKEGVSLCITMAGIAALWCGIMEIAQKSGLISWMEQKMRPILKFLFPGIPKNHPVLQDISVNMISNFLGLGWAATPAGLRAMDGLRKINEERCKKYGGTPNIASNEMCTFLIINISSLQLIPVNIIAYRSQYGSVNPTAILGPAVAATAVSTGVAVLFCKMMNRKWKEKKRYG